ncbi:hypothetical protein GCM10012275_58180 [Longimycelium tulufanense]|uniref:Luciferase-like domain-containing protein n=1 Tax=Longimycelium tulufanense TaxID=907463 RepID=A0A8J3FZF6_9PSEU|nr:hypothetical protein GCM10012275_58180 [Longimycelium tulufanense]
MFAASFAPALRRITTRGAGWLAPPDIDEYRQFAPRIREQWRQQGRSGEPYLVATRKYALGSDAVEALDRVTRHYYSFAGPELIESLIAQAMTTPERINAAINAYEEAGCDELVFLSQHDAPEQVERLADIVIDRLDQKHQRTERDMMSAMVE